MATSKAHTHMPVPTDAALYARVKRQVYKDIPKHSAYRSGIVVQKYKRAYKSKHKYGSPYRAGSKRSGSLTRWFQERWRNQRGEVGYKYKSDVYRPTRRVSRKTPRTFKQLGSRRVRKAMRQKARSGRVNQF